MNKTKLRHMLADENKRQQLREFELLKIFISSRAKQQMGFIEELAFYTALATAESESENEGYFTTDLEEFWFVICEIEAESHQAQGAFRVDVYAYFEWLDMKEARERGERLAEKVFGDIDIV
ncbi:hypothetical protein [Thalassotalea sp. SU-HH00458]|uniref:hypothetical protein n=1 Tax=Thalassotalea sp. SU-HH00458 TaxID=3127657 RepID=UPI003109F787